MLKTTVGECEGEVVIEVEVVGFGTKGTIDVLVAKTGLDIETARDLGSGEMRSCLFVIDVDSLVEVFRNLRFFSRNKSYLLLVNVNLRLLKLDLVVVRLLHIPDGLKESGETTAPHLFSLPGGTFSGAAVSLSNLVGFFCESEEEEVGYANNSSTLMCGAKFTSLLLET